MFTVSIWVFFSCFSSIATLYLYKKKLISHYYIIICGFFWKKIQSFKKIFYLFSETWYTRTLSSSSRTLRTLTTSTSCWRTAPNGPWCTCSRPGMWSPRSRPGTTCNSLWTACSTSTHRTSSTEISNWAIYFWLARWRWKLAISGSPPGSAGRRRGQSAARRITSRPRCWTRTGTGSRPTSGR